MTDIFNDLQAVARAQMSALQKAPLVIWPPAGAKQCLTCGDVTDGPDYCDCACEYAHNQLEEERDKFANIHNQ